ncbi:aspartyl protease family protein [candidate division WOR-3 bacterium]|nr:aspartyl protease family protein [candidate division WOR-3 bacterium]
MKFAKAVIVLVLVASISYSTENLTDPYQILNRHYEAIGGLDKLKAQKTTYVEGSITIEGTGLQGQFKKWSDGPIRSRQEVDLTIIKTISGDNGEFSWQIDTNGKLVINKDENTINARRVQELLGEYENLNPESPYFDLSFEGIQKVGDVDCYVVKMTNSINKDVTLYYYDTSDFYLEKQVEIKPDMKSHTVFSDYRNVNGVKHSFQQEIEILPIEQKQTIKISKYEVNIDIDTKLFEPPGQDVEDFRFLNGKSAENVPFRFIENHIFLPVNINCNERLWILDSGASATVVDIRYASELGLELQGTLKGVGAEHIVDVSFTTLPSFNIQGLQFDEQQVAAVDISSILQKAMGTEIVGVLGYDFLSRLVTKIDYANETISFYYPDSFDYSGSGQVIETPLEDRFFIVPMSINSKYSGKWTLDLGAGGLTFHFPFAERNNLLDLEGVDRIGFGAGGEIKSRISKFHTSELGDFVVHYPLVSIPRQKGKGTFAHMERTGNIGNSLLRHFVLFLDYKKQQIILEQGKHFGRDFPTDKSGLQLLVTEDADFEVFFVSPNTPAMKAAFQKGDIVQSINGIKADYFGGIISIRDLLREKAGTRYTFEVLRNETTKELILELEELY